MKSLIFQGMFLPKVLPAAVFKNSGICENCSMLKDKKSLMDSHPYDEDNPYERRGVSKTRNLLTKLEKLK